MSTLTLSSLTNLIIDSIYLKKIVEELNKIIKKMENRQKLFENFYYQMCRLYFCSYKPNNYKSIYHFYTKFMLNDYKFPLWSSLQWREKLCWYLTMIMTAYYLGNSVRIFNLNEETKFMISDIGKYITDNIQLQRTISFQAGFASLIFLIIIYYSFDTSSSHSLRTFLLFMLNDDDNDDNNYQNQSKYYSQSSMILIDYLMNNVQIINPNRFKSIYNNIYCVAQFFHCK